MTRRAALVLVAVVLAGCSTKSRTPPIQIFPDMKDQPKYLPQAESHFFSDGRELRRPVPGTVARGFLKADDAFSTGMANGAYVSNPLPISLDTLKRGQDRFNIYCAPCHDKTGSGRGIVATRASWLASSLTEDRIRQMPDGQIFETITNGRRTMPAYRFQVGERDRWAIVAYVRALERAANGAINDVPADLRGDLR